MEVYQEDRYWRIQNTHGPVPNQLKGDWVSQEKAEQALLMFKELVRSKTINVSQKHRERKERATTTT